MLRRRLNSSAFIFLALAALCAVPGSPQPPPATGAAPGAIIADRYDFSGVSAAINTAIEQKKLPGAVVLIGHDGKVVFEQAYGVRKLAGEPGIDGKPSPAEPMTVDTIFDMASLTKCLVTATAVMQLYEQGKLKLDDPVAKYLPEFGVNGKEKVTIRELLTHYSGLPPDVDLKDSWGLTAPDKAEGLRRAMNAKLDSTPGTKFVYSDINFMTLGALVERLSGQRLDDYAQQHIFTPLGMTETTFSFFYCSCSNPKPPAYGTAAWSDYQQRKDREKADRAAKPPIIYGCSLNDCQGPSLPLASVAPTQHDDQGTAETNPNFDHLLRGTVHDPTTRRMGGVAGQAGVFSTAHDVSLFAQALLDKLLHNTGPFPLDQSTLKLMTTPQQPSTAKSGATVFTYDGKTTTGVAQRGLGWDINSAYSRPRGTIFPTQLLSPNIQEGPPPSFGHTGFTGTSLWIDPASDTYIILLANSVHPRGNPTISPLRGEVATAAAKALHVCYANDCTGMMNPAPRELPTIPSSNEQMIAPPGGALGNNKVERQNALKQQLHSDDRQSHAQTAVRAGQPAAPAQNPALLKGTALAVPNTQAPFSAALAAGVTVPGDTTAHVLVGIDVLETSHFKALTDLAAKHGGHLRIGLLTNQTGLDAQGQRTIDILRSGSARGMGVELVRLFSPEHGLFGKRDSTTIGEETDAASGLRVISLYGPKDTDKRPKPEDLRDLDAVVIDLQDAGARFYTYETVLGYFLEASACEAAKQHDLRIIVLDRPDPIGGLAVEGPVSNMAEAYINYMPEPLRQGMTLGELARYMAAEHPGACAASRDARASLTVVPMQGWHRDEFFDQTGVKWVNPSPNLRTMEAAVLYPALGMLDYSNVSVGRGSETPFEVFGAGVEAATKDSPAKPAQNSSWFDGKTVAAYLTARKIAGVAFASTRFAVAEDENRYPYHGQTIEGVRLTVTDRAALDSPELGIEILSALHHLYPAQFRLDKAAGLVANTETMAALERGDDPRSIAAGWAKALNEFKARRTKYLLYP